MSGSSLIQSLEAAEGGRRRLRGQEQSLGEAAAWPDMKSWRREVARRLWDARARLRANDRPLRLMTEGSAVVVYADALPGSRPFAIFSLDSRSPEFYSVAVRAAHRVVSAILRAREGGR